MKVIKGLFVLGLTTYLYSIDWLFSYQGFEDDLWDGGQQRWLLGVKSICQSRWRQSKMQQKNQFLEMSVISFFFFQSAIILFYEWLSLPFHINPSWFFWCLIICPVSLLEHGINLSRSLEVVSWGSKWWISGNIV